MKIGIIGGGLAGLSTAYYLKKLSLPVSQIILFESSNRFGGWISSEKIYDKENNNRKIIFESSARILRYKPLQRREINTLNLTNDLGLKDEIEIISDEHPGSRNRFIYLDGQLKPFNPNITLNENFGLYYLYKEFRGIKRSCDIKDESIYSFITRRFGSDFADKIVDPYFKNICSGDIKELSAASLLKGLYMAESKYGSIIKGYMRDRQESRIRMKERFTNFSVWKFKNGMQSLVDKLIENLKQYNDVKLNNNETCMSLNFNENSVQIKTNKSLYDVDLVISGVYSKYLENMLSNEHSKLKALLNKIDAVDMIVVNLYFDKNILPAEGFGYFVPTIENSPILTCLFDSIFDTDNKNFSTITLLMGGSQYKKYFDKTIEQDSNKLLEFSLNALKKQIKIDINPKYHKISILKNSIPQYKVGHESLINEINKYLNEKKLNNKLYLIGSSYNGFGIKDVIYNSKVLCEKQLKNRIN